MERTVFLYFAFIFCIVVAVLFLIIIVRKKHNKKFIDVSVGVIYREKDGLFFLAQRNPDLRFAGEWEFPGGRVERGENSLSCVRRELSEEVPRFNLIVNKKPCFICEHNYSEPDGRIHRIAYFLCEFITGEFILPVHQDYVWVKKEELLNYNLVEAEKKMVKMLLGEYGESDKCIYVKLTA